MRRFLNLRLLMLLAAAIMAVSLTACDKTVGDLFPFGEEESDSQANRTKKSIKYQEELAEEVRVSNAAVSEDEYGDPVLTATVTMPDYSMLFYLYWEDAEKEAKDFKDFEERLLKLARDYMEEAGNSGSSGSGAAAGNSGSSGSGAAATYEVGMVSREICIDTLDSSEGLFDASGNITVDGMELLTNAAVEAELEEFAMDIMRGYTLQEVEP